MGLIFENFGTVMRKKFENMTDSEGTGKNWRRAGEELVECWHGLLALKMQTSRRGTVDFDVFV